METIKTIHELKSEAMRWWAILTPEERIIYSEIHHGDERHPATLTGGEILEIYKISIA